MDDVHILTAVVEKCGSIEISFLSYPVSTAQHLCSLCYCTVYFLRYAFEGTLFHERSHVDVVGREWVAHFDSLELIEQELREFLLNVLMYV